MIQNKNTISKTMDEFIEMTLPNALQFQNSSYFTIISNEIMEDYNIYRDRYYNTLMQHVTRYTMNDSDFIKFRYRPKRLSAHLYKSIDYWYILLIINKMSSRMQFIKKDLNILTYSGILVINELAKKEEKEIAANKAAIIAKIKHI